ncbi:MAG: M23 family metallopeptidase [Spirochaetaceae bacterium]|jgi:LysM repeat protein|nr:M23 family metallopeptidase [Spirochaetaceae bacterium]
MVVSADCQKIVRNKRRYQSRKVSSYKINSYMRVKGMPIPLYKIPFICSLFIFSIYINISDVYWNIKTLDFIEDDIILPKENTLLASVGRDFLSPQTPVSENPEKSSLFSTYTVREDDRYSIIADKFQIDTGTLLSVNGITSAEKPVEGSKLLIPNISGIFYNVKKGDTLTSIAKEYNLDIAEISLINNLYTSVIHYNEKLFLPGIIMSSDEIKKISGEKFLIPATGTIKNNYGSSLDSVTGLKYYNYGIDIINSKGTTVYAARDGIINNTSYNPYYGKVVLLNHSGSYQSMYGCLDRIVVKPGQSVKSGDILGYMGNSGFKSGYHLQFSIFKNEEDVDTLEYIF